MIRKVPDVGLSLAPESGDHEKYLLYNYVLTRVGGIFLIHTGTGFGPGPSKSVGPNSVRGAKLA